MYSGIVEILKEEHPVWKLLEKDKYTEEGIIRKEAMYDFINNMIIENGNATMRALFNYWNEYSDEIFCILDELTHKY